MTKLNAALPKPHGLGVIAQDLIDDPYREHLVIAVVNCKSTTTDYDTGDIIPTARILQIEAATGGLEGDALDLLNRAHKQRLARASGTLPYDEDTDEIPID